MWRPVAELCRTNLNRRPTRQSLVLGRCQTDLGAGLSVPAHGGLRTLAGIRTGVPRGVLVVSRIRRVWSGGAPVYSILGSVINLPFPHDAFKKRRSFLDYLTGVLLTGLDASQIWEPRSGPGKSNPRGYRLVHLLYEKPILADSPFRHRAWWTICVKPSAAGPMGFWPVSLTLWPTVVYKQ